MNQHFAQTGIRYFSDHTRFLSYNFWDHSGKAVIAVGVSETVKLSGVVWGIADESGNPDLGHSDDFDSGHRLSERKPTKATNKSGSTAWRKGSGVFQIVVTAY
jgi:hypothetical protein